MTLNFMSSENLFVYSVIVLLGLNVALTVLQLFCNAQLISSVGHWLQISFYNPFLINNPYLTTK